MEPVPLAGPFNAPELYAHPLLLAAMAGLLGPDFVIGSMTLVTSQPGADPQHLHADHPPLFPDSPLGASLPAHACTVLIPLVDIDEAVGGTEVCKGTHRFAEAASAGPVACAMRLGDCLVFDYRLAHRGMANRSSRVRPVLSIVYQRAWFRDAVNFGGVDALQVPLEERSRIPESLAGLFRFAAVIAPAGAAP
jgi:ectoine hydroxylase-related dioxygenase (phytanoyl-CoA dioxygenase family)